MTPVKKTIYVCLLVVLFVASYACWYGREVILLNLGEFLFDAVGHEKSDVIVVLRGDRNYARVLEAARLFQNGDSDCIYISTALVDEGNRKLKERGVELPSEQQRLKSILIQLGTPQEQIMLGYRVPGGGTLGEVKRIKAVMLERKFDKAIIVTSWWHTRRTNKICEEIFDGTDMRVYAVAARNDVSNPSNWWKYRYEALNVLEEFPKLLICCLLPSSSLTFNDDPTDADKNPQAVSGID